MDHNNIVDGRHLIFAEEDMNSDGSDYVPSGQEEDDESSFNSDNHDMEIDTFPMSRIILSKCNMVFIPPQQPNWSEISVETLRGLIQKHRDYVKYIRIRIITKGLILKSISKLFHL